MRLLLDTHVALWAILDDARLGIAREMITDDGNEVFVSAASVWEIAIKHSLWRGRPNDMPISGQQAHQFFQKAVYAELVITAKHAAGVAALPTLHSDPFDRILLAQATIEPMRLITHDKKIAAYGGPTLLV